MLDSLNPNQLAAVTADPNAPVLVLAGAGSGKTKTLTHRIAWLIGEGVDPSQILALTFTNKASKEMTGRVENLLGRRLRTSFAPDLDEEPLVCTFHSFGVRFLRAFCEEKFTIFDSGDVQQIGRKICKEMELDVKQWLRQLLSAVSKAKNALVAPGTGESEPFRTNVVRFYEKYKKELDSQRGFDFDDLLVKPVQQLTRDDDLREALSARFAYILVDEYQDTNPVQYQLLRLLGSHGRITAVGDDDQAIYSWRGATVENILNFERDFVDAKVVRLEQNYRSTQPILDAAYAVISKNSNRHDKKLWTEQSGGEVVRVVECYSERDEAERVVREVKEMVED